MLDTLFYLFPNLSCVTLPSIVEHALLNLHLFLCSVVLLSLPRDLYSCQ